MEVGELEDNINILCQYVCGLDQEVFPGVGKKIRVQIRGFHKISAKDKTLVQIRKCHANY
jgi:hypothetical protein